MKVTGATCRLLPLKTIYAVELHTDEQLTGLSLVSTDACAYVGRIVNDLLVGEDPRAVTGLFQRMSAARTRHDEPRAITAISALDIALWDLKAKFNEEPLWKTLGGSRPRVPIHAGSIDPDASHAALTEWYGTTARSFGCKSGKLQATPDLKADREHLVLLQSALGGSADLALQAHSAWTAKDAIQHVRALEHDFDISWIEAPARGWDFLANRSVVESVRAALCVGAGFATLEELHPHLHNRSVSILKIGAESGGITGALQKADAAFGFELPVLLEASIGHLNAQLAGALPYCMSLEVLDPLVTTDVSLAGGWATAGDRPGNGLQP